MILYTAKEMVKEEGFKEVKTGGMLSEKKEHGVGFGLWVKWMSSTIGNTGSSY